MPMKPRMLFTAQGDIFIVDFSEYDRLAQYRWSTSVSRGNLKYAKSYVDGKVTYLHRLLLSVPHGDSRQVDHIDRNTLNNTRTNLRLCSASQNHANRPVGNKSTTGLKGVVHAKHNKTNRWRAQISVGDRVRNLGYYPTKEKAAEAYNKAAKAAFGEFAWLNKIGGAA